MTTPTMTIPQEVAERAAKLMREAAQQLMRTGGMLNKDVARDLAKAEADLSRSIAAVHAAPVSESPARWSLQAPSGSYPLAWEGSPAGESAQSEVASDPVVRSGE